MHTFFFFLETTCFVDIQAVNHQIVCIIEVCKGTQSVFNAKHLFACESSFLASLLMCRLKLLFRDFDIDGLI